MCAMKAVKSIFTRTRLPKLSLPIVTLSVCGAEVRESKKAPPGAHDPSKYRRSTKKAVYTTAPKPSTEEKDSAERSRSNTSGRSATPATPRMACVRDAAGIRLEKTSPMMHV